MDAEGVENCITDITLMYHWLNPILCCEPLGKWSRDLGNQAKFKIKIPSQCEENKKDIAL